MKACRVAVVFNGIGARATWIGVSLACLASACEGERCLAYDYAPPSARLTLSDAATGEPLCTRADYVVTTSRGPAIPHEDACEWWLPAWTDADAGATASEIQVRVTGYQPQTLSIARVTDECGEVQQPPLLELQLEPAPPE
jgi:hypothetical protein